MLYIVISWFSILYLTDQWQGCEKVGFCYISNKLTFSILDRSTCKWYLDKQHRPRMCIHIRVFIVAKKTIFLVSRHDLWSYKLYQIFIWFFMSIENVHLYMGLVARKPVFGGLGTTQAQTSLRIRAVWSAPLLFAFWKILYVNLLLVKFQFSRLSL